MNSANVSKILKNGILKLELSFEQNLCPGCLLWVREDPALVVFSLYNEYAKPRNEDMIHLSGSVLEAKSYIVQQVIVRRCEVGHELAPNQCLALVLKRIGSVASYEEADNGAQENIEENSHICADCCLR